MNVYIMLRNDDVTGDMPVEAYTDEVIANMYAYNNYCDPWYAYVKRATIPYVGNNCYIVVDTKLAAGCDYGYTSVAGVYANQKYAYKSSAYRMAKEKSNNTKRANALIWTDDQGVEHKTEVLRISIFKNSFCKKKHRKLVTSGVIDNVTFNVTFNVDEESTISVKRSGRRRVNVKGKYMDYDVIEMATGYVIYNNRYGILTDVVEADASFDYIAYKMIEDTWQDTMHDVFTFEYEGVGF
jgi:hypothetical protein